MCAVSSATIWPQSEMDGSGGGVANGRKQDDRLAEVIMKGRSSCRARGSALPRLVGRSGHVARTCRVTRLAADHRDQEEGDDREVEETAHRELLPESDKCAGNTRFRPLLVVLNGNYIFTAERFVNATSRRGPGQANSKKGAARRAEIKCPVISDGRLRPPPGWRGFLRA